MKSKELTDKRPKWGDYIHKGQKLIENFNASGKYYSDLEKYTNLLEKALEEAEKFDNYDKGLQDGRDENEPLRLKVNELTEQLQQKEEEIDRLNELNFGYLEALEIKAKELEQSKKELIEKALNCIPTNWLDPKLTGKTKAITGEAGKWGCPDIESLLSAIRKELEETLTNEGDGK